MAVTVRTFTEQHGIKSVVFALEFAAPLQPEVFLAIRDGDCGSALKAQLPRQQEQRSIVLSVPNAPMASVSFQMGVDSSSQPLTGLQYDRVAPDGRQEWAVSIQQNSLLVTCGSYARWRPTSDVAKSFIRTLIPLLNGAEVATVGLQYVDEFQSVVPKQEFSLEGLFSRTSQFVPQNLVTRRGPSHSHHGYFDELDVPPARVLNNINVNVLEEPSSYRIEIVGSHRCMLRQPMALRDARLLENDAPLGVVWERLHTHNKDIIGDMLIDEVKQAINFGGVVAQS